MSNSLPLLLVLEDLSLGLAYREFDIKLLALLDGLPPKVPHIPTQEGPRVGLHYCSNLAVWGDLSVTETEKPSFEEHRADYADYMDFLVGSSRHLMSSAADFRRAVRFDALATVSSGYDSPVCVVLARSVAATEAVTLGHARSDFAHGDDSGRQIGERLGLSLVEFDRTAYLERDDLPEMEFLAMATGGEDVVMAALEEALRGKVLFTGFLGDTVWSLKHSTEPSTRYRRADRSGASLQEFRLRVGFIHFPVPQASPETTSAALSDLIIRGDGSLAPRYEVR